MVQWVGRRQFGGPGDKQFVVSSRIVTGTVRPASYTPESDHLQPPAASTRVASAMAVVPPKAAAAAKSQAAAKFQVTAKAEAAAKGPAATSGNVPPRDSARRAGRGPVSAKQKGFQKAAINTADPLVLRHSRRSSVHALIPEAGLYGAEGGSTLATGLRHIKSKGKGHDALTGRVTLAAIASNTLVIGKKGCRGNSVNRARQCAHGSRKTRCPICVLKSNGGAGSLCVHLKQKGWCLECKKDGTKYYGDRCSKDSEKYACSASNKDQHARSQHITQKGSRSLKHPLTPLSQPMPLGEIDLGRWGSCSANHLSVGFLVGHC